MKKLNFILPVLFVVAIFAGCLTPGSDNYRNLVTHQWELKEIVYADSSYSVTAPAGITINFSDSTTVSGRGPCNGFFGEYEELGYDQLNLILKGSTLALCLNQDFEDRYFRILDNVASYDASENTLNLYNLSKTVTLVYKPSTTNN